MGARSFALDLVLALGLATLLANAACERADRGGHDESAAGSSAPTSPSGATGQGASERSAGGSGAQDRPRWPELPGLELPPDWDTAHPTFSPNARLDVHAAALAERALGTSPADTAGRVRLARVDRLPTSGEAPSEHDEVRPAANGRPLLPASSRARFTVILEVGSPGIVMGGSVFVLPDPFWFWSEAQTGDPAALGYTTARLLDPSASTPSSSTDTPASPTVQLVPGEAPGSFRVEGRALASGERLEIVYGAGPGGARVDRYAESGSAIRIGLDADADGRRGWLASTAAIDVTANAAERLVAFGPAEVAPGDRFELNLALVDSVGNQAAWPSAERKEQNEVGLELAVEARPGAELAPADGLGQRSVRATGDEPLRWVLVAPAEPGTLRLRVRGAGALARFEAELPPILVRRARERLVWADLHGHSAWSDGSGTPDAYFRYARDVARLDAVALTDHDHWGIEALDAAPARRAEILAATRAHHAPGRFVTLPGYEWTSWLHGHRHVLSFDDTLPFFSSLDFATDRPDELWAALRGRPVLTFAHHSAGEPVATDWHFEPDPELEPVTEITSVHGTSEADDAPAPVEGAIPGNFVRDVLLYGAKLGFVGSGDSHDGHPGLAAIAAGQGGLAGIFTESLDRAPLRDALKRRHVFATNGIRPWLEVSIDGVPMGGTLTTPNGAARSDDQLLRIRYEATAPIARIELIRTGRIAQLDRRSVGAPGDAPFDHLDLERRVPRLRPGEFHYVRIVQTDGGIAWSSPIFAERDESQVAGTGASSEGQE